MKGNQAVVDRMQSLLANELAAVIQYETHLAVAMRLGLTKLVEYLKERRDDEAKHAEMLRTRLQQLEVLPAVDVGEIDTSEDIEQALKNDDSAELTAIRDTQDAIEAACQNSDEGSAEILRDILRDEVEHKLDTETRLVLIDLMGKDNWLSAQL